MVSVLSRPTPPSRRAITRKARTGASPDSSAVIPQKTAATTAVVTRLRRSPA